MRRLLHKVLTEACVCLLTVACVGLVSSSSIADEAELRAEVPTSDKRDKEVNDLLDQLSSPVYQLRRRAFLGLWQVGADALPAIREAAKSTNSQLAKSAQVLDVLLKLSLTPGNNDEVLGLVRLLSNPSPATIAELCRRKHWNAALEILRGDPDLEMSFKRGSGALQLRRIAETALRQGDPSLAWPIVSRLSKLSVASWLSNKNGLQPPVIDEANGIQVAVRDFYLGDAEKAFAQSSLPARERIEFATRNASWSVLLEDDLKSTLSAGASPTTRQAIEAVLYELAGNFRAADEGWETLFSHAGDDSRLSKDSGDGSSDQSLDSPAELAPKVAAGVRLLKAEVNPGQLILAMSMAGYVEPVEQYLIEVDPDHAFIYLIGQSRIEDALGAIGLEPDLANFQAWTTQQLNLIGEDDKAPEYTRFGIASRLCSLLINMGYREQAEDLLSMLIEAIEVKKSETPKSSQLAVESKLWSFLQRSLTRAESREILFSRFKKRYDKIPERIRPSFFYSLFPDIALSAKELLATAPNTLNTGVASAQPDWESLDHLWRMDAEYFGENAQKIVGDWIDRTRKEIDSEPSGMQLSELAQLALGFGLVDRAFELSMDPGARDQDHWLDAADMLMQRGSPAEASRILSQYRNSYYSQRQYEMLSKEIEALLLAGDFDEAERLEQFKWILPHDANLQGSTYSSVGYSLIRAEEWENACEYLEPAFLFADFRRGDARFLATSYANCLYETGQFQRSADVMSAALVESLQRGADLPQILTGAPRYYEYLGYLISSIQKERMSRSLASIDRGDYSSAKRYMRAAERIRPQDIELAVVCYPILIEKGQSELADEIFDSFTASLKRQIDTWPSDATALNNLAWLYSQCDRNLHEALSLVTKAVELAPHSGVFLDTLAEVYFRLGNREKAIEITKICIKLDPRESHYRKNLVRFSKNRTVAPSN